MVGRNGIRQGAALLPALGLMLGVVGLASAQSPPPASYIVTFSAPPTANQLEMLRGIALGVHGYQHLPAAAVLIPPGTADLVANLPGVAGVYPNRVLPWMLDNSTDTLRADGVWAAGYTGAGIGIAVIDAGVDGTHPDLCAAVVFCNGTPIKTVQNVKIIGRESVAEPVVVIENQISTDSTSGHGSHVAGIAAGFGTASETPGKYRGVAHGASLIGLGTGEVAEVDTVLAGFDWVLGHHQQYNIKVINNSWGPGPGHPFDPNEPVQLAIAAAYDAGMAVVFGSGNAGPTTDTLNAFSANPKAISAAAGTKAGHIAVFSSRGVPGSTLWRPTVTAPGMFIASVRARTGFYADVADASGPDPSDPILPPDDVSYAYASGTSMSAPHISGLIALLQQASKAHRNTYLTPAEVRNVLQNTAVSADPARGPGGLPGYQGYTMGAGYADAVAAVNAAATGAQLGPYNDGVVEDVRGFKGTVGPAAFFPVQSFESTFAVGAGALSLDVMVDWSQAAQDLDIELYRPDGTLDQTTFLRCAAAEGPNQYSSFCTAIANERVNVVAPVAGTWRAVIRGGSLSATETAFGMWSAIYPDGTALPPGQAAANVTVTGPATPNLTGQSVALTATVTDAAGNPVPNAAVTWSSAGVGSVTAGETLTDQRGVAMATARSDSPGTQTVTAQSGSASGSAVLTWVGPPGPPTPPPPPGSNTPGKASGGGHFMAPNKRHFSFHANYDPDATGPAGKLGYDSKDGVKVDADVVSSFQISGGNRATIRGPAKYNGLAGHRFELVVVDHGEPGTGDTINLVVTKDGDPIFRYETGGTLSGGNIQVKPD